MSGHQRENRSENWINDARRRLADWRGRKPETKAGQIRALWPEIKGAIEDGQSMRSIREWLEEEAGVVVTTGSLRSYFRRCRENDAGRRPRKDLASSDQKPLPDILLRRATPPKVNQSDSAHDPMATAREALSKPRFDIRKIHADGDPTGRNLI